MATVVEGVGVLLRPAIVRTAKTVRPSSPCPPNFTYRSEGGRCFCDATLQGLRGLAEEIPCPEVATATTATAAPKATLYRTAPSATLAPVPADAYQQPPPSSLPKAPPIYALPNFNPAPGTTVEQPGPDPRDMVFPSPGDGDEEKALEGGGSGLLIGAAIAGAGLLFLLFTSRDDKNRE